MKLSHERVRRILDELEAKDPNSFWERFELAFEHRVDEVYSSRLHPFKVMGWNLRHPNQSWSEFHERGNNAARSSFKKALEYSLRDAAVGLPIVGWLETQEDALADLFVDSVDAVEEEAVSPTDPWYGATERVWWQSIDKRVFRFGVRPFRSDPYAYASMRIQDGDKLKLRGHVRYYLENFADHRFELAFSAPLTHGFTLDLGTAYQFGPHEDEQLVVAKLFKPLKNGGVVHVGVEIQESPAVFAGFSMPW